MTSSASGEERSLIDFLGVLRSRWLWVVVPFATFVGLGIYLTMSSPPRYEVTARVLLGTTAAQEAVASQLNLNTGVASRDLVNEISVAESDGVRQLVRERLELAPNDELPEGKITADIGSDVLSFAFSATEPERASLVTNTWAQAYVDFKRDAAQASIDDVVAKLEAELAAHSEERDDLRAGLERLENQLARTRDLEERDLLQLEIEREKSSISGGLTVVDAQIQTTVNDIAKLRLSSELAGAAQLVQAATIPSKPTSAPLSRNLAVAVALGLLVGSGLALLADNLDRSLRTTGDIERLGLTTLGSVPRAPRRAARNSFATVVANEPGSSYSDGYQRIRSAVDFIGGTDVDGNALTSILVTSPNEGDGKSTTTINLALAYASAGRKTLIVDADTRRPSVHEALGIPQRPGTGDLLTPPTHRAADMIRATPVPPHVLGVIPAGTLPTDPASFLASTVVTSALDELGRVAEFVLIDAPPVLAVADALSLARSVDGVVLVARAGKTSDAQLIEAARSVQQAGGRLLGVVLNQSNTGTGRYYYDRDSTNKRAPWRRQRATPPTPTPSTTPTPDIAQVTVAARSPSVRVTGPIAEFPAVPPLVPPLPPEPTVDTAPGTPEAATPPAETNPSFEISPLSSERHHEGLVGNNGNGSATHEHTDCSMGHDERSAAGADAAPSSGTPGSKEEVDELLSLLDKLGIDGDRRPG